MARRIFFGSLLAACTACVAETEDLQYQDLVPVTVRIEDYRGALTLLFSTPQGGVFDVVNVDAPLAEEFLVPRGSAVSVRFASDEVQSGNVFSIADLDAGEEAVFRPWIWHFGDRWIEIGPVRGTLPGLLDVDYGCGGYGGITTPTERSFRSTIAERCENDPFRVGFSTFDGEQRRLATRAHPLASTDSMEAPAAADFIEAPRTVSIEVSGAPIDRRSGSLSARGVIDAQTFGMFDSQKLSRSIDPAWWTSKCFLSTIERCCSTRASIATAIS